MNDKNIQKPVESTPADSGLDAAAKSKLPGELDLEELEGVSGGNYPVKNFRSPFESESES